MWFSLFFSVNNITKPMYYCLYIHENFQLFWNLFHFSSSPLGLGSLSSQIPSLGALVPLALGSFSPVRNPGAELRSRKLWALLQVGTELAAGSSSSGVPPPNGNLLPLWSPLPLGGSPLILQSLRYYLDCLPILHPFQTWQGTTWLLGKMSVFLSGPWVDGAVRKPPWSLESRHCI